MANNFVIRKAESTERIVQVAEELSKPPACVTASSITVWVYRDITRFPPLIREVVVSGHAEQSTCKRATAALIDAAKSLSGDVEWMLIAGAGYFRVNVVKESAIPTFADLLAGNVPGLARTDQGFLEQMVTDLRKIAAETGLLELVDPAAYEDLVQLRKGFQAQGTPGRTEVKLPTGERATPAAAFMPIVPHGKSAPLKFHLEGWDFDSPVFQQVADLHLRTLQRDLLADSLHRLRVYRSWLEESVKHLAERLLYLPKDQALNVSITVPGEEPGMASAQSVLFVDFLKKHVGQFISKEARWHKLVLYRLNFATYGRMKAEDLDRKRIPDEVMVYDPNTLQKVPRRGTEADASSLRDQITKNAPSMVSGWLGYIRSMQRIVAPYQNLRVKRGPERGKGDQEAALLDEISRRIVLESMVRGWPPVFLEEGDRSVFAQWAEQAREPIWRLMNQQAAEQGISPEILLEENVIYDVRFNDELGCSLQPLMLVDQTNHAWLRGGKSVGANASIPLWNRSTPVGFSEEILGLGTTNTQRAHALVGFAAQFPEPSAVAVYLKAAMACHPAEGGFAILDEWRRRLGRPTEFEFILARHAVQAREFYLRGRYAEAASALDEYLACSGDLLPEAWGLRALCQLQAGHQSMAKLRVNFMRQENLRERVEALEPTFEKLKSNPQSLTQLEIDQLTALDKLSKQLNQELESARALQKEEFGLVRELVARALASPPSVKDEYPSLSHAAGLIPSFFRPMVAAELEDSSPNRLEFTAEWNARYGAARIAIEAQGLLELSDEIALAIYFVKEGQEEEREKAFQLIDGLTRRLWLTDAAESKLHAFVDDVRDYLAPHTKGVLLGRDPTKKWDSWLIATVGNLLEGALGDCLQEIHSRLRIDDVTRHCGFAESWETQIHLRQVYLRNYREAFNMLIEPVVTFGRATGPWTVLDAGLQAPPAGSQLQFFGAQGRIDLVTPEASRIPLLQAEDPGDLECGYVADLVDGLLENRAFLAPNLASSLLDAVVKPSPRFKIWAEAMTMVRRELLFAISNYSFRASLLPDADPKFTEAGKKRYAERDCLEPYSDVQVDWQWKNRGSWARFVS